jgi:hypothetical protein
VLKEQLKELAGAKVNPLDVERFRRAGLWQDDFAVRSVSPRLWAIAALPLVNAALSALYLAALLASLAWVLAVERRWLAEPLVRVALGFAVAGWALLCLLQYEPRQANALHFFGLPLVAIGAETLARRGPWALRGAPVEPPDGAAIMPHRQPHPEERHAR